jgi:nucleoside-diphosphate-sugar epimerase
MHRPRILVTGGTGFIGGWVVETLNADGAEDVVAGVRHTSPRLDKLPIELANCDVLDQQSLENAMEGIDVVIHCARDPAKGATVEGTRRLLDAIRIKRVKRLVHMSSIAVYGEADGVVTEDMPPSPVDEYGADKLAEEALCRAAAEPGFTVAVVRPSLVYGPFGHVWTTRFIEGIIEGRLKQFPQAHGEANLIYVGDLARFAAELTIRPLPEYSVFNANGAEIPTFNKYFDSLSRALGQGPLPLSDKQVRGRLTRQVRRAARLVLRTQGTTLRRIADSKPSLQATLSHIEKSVRYDIGDEPVSRYAKHVVYSNDRARQFGLNPRTSLREGIDASVRWLKSIGAEGDGERMADRPAQIRRKP